MNTNNINVRLQQHVVLLTVMEHAEDLIIKFSSDLSATLTNSRPSDISVQKAKE
jgi:hypothetical protein